MTFNKLILILALVSTHTFAQDSIKMTNSYGVEQAELQDLMDFEGIYVETLNFESPLLKGKHYEVRLHEYKNGKFAKSTVLFDSSEDDYFKIRDEKLSLRYYFKLADEQLKLYIAGSTFRSKKRYFDLKTDADQYALKDFFDRNTELKLDPVNPNFVLAIITPTRHKDGSASYCEVVQSNIKPEDLGTHFHIPHYFLVSITFK